MRLRTISLSLVMLLLVVAAVGCGGGGGPAPGPGGNGGYEEDFVEIDLTNSYGISLVHPGRGWEQTMNLAQQRRWKEVGDEAEFEIYIVGMTLNPNQYRVDLGRGGWEVLNQEEINYPGLDNPILFTHAVKDDDGFEIGALQLYFSRSYNAPSPWYYIITLRNYDFEFDATYQDIFEEVVESLEIIFE